MKKLYTVVGRTKAEYGSNVSPGTEISVAYPTFPAAKAAFKTALGAGTESYFELYGPEGLIQKRVNPAGG